MKAHLKFLLTLGCLFVPCLELHAATIGVEAYDLKLVRGTNRVWKHSEGWLLRMSEPGEVQSGEFALPQKLVPGKYHLFIKARNGGASLRVACGGGTAEPSDGRGPWTSAVPIEIKTPAETITLRVANGRTEAVNFILQALCVTDRENVIVDAADCVVQLPAAATPDDSPAIPGNRIPNSSFEAGLGRGWLVSTPNERRDVSVATFVDETAGSHGRASLRLPAWSSATSRVFRVRPWRKHTFSLFAKADAAGASVVMEVVNVHQEHARLGPVTKLKQAFPLEASRWQRLVLGDRLGGFPAPEYQLRIACTDQPVQIDAVQLEEGDVSDYRPLAAVEIGLVSEKPANLFFEDEPIRMKLLAFNGDSRPVVAKARYEVYDYLNRKLKQGEVEIATQAGSRHETSLDLATGTRGIFRVAIWIEGASGTDEEVVFAVLPRPQRAGRDPSSIIGVHAIASDFQYEVLERMGVKWTRIMSPELWFRWHVIEPKRGQFVWHDAEAEKTVRHGVEILGNISTPVWPAWAIKDGKPDLAAWEQSVFAIVGHYKPWIRHWEICNEPVHEFKPEFYAEVLKAATRAIRKADPEAKIVGMGGSYDCNWCLAVIKELGDRPRDFMDYLSTHVYPEKADPLNPLKDAAEKVFLDRIIVPHKLEVWNTEAGTWSLGFYQGGNSGFRTAGEPLSPAREAWRYYRGCDYSAALVARSFLHSIGNGFSRYFYYDTRFHAASYAAGQSHCTLFDLGDTLKAEGIAYAINAKFFDHAKGLGNVSPNRNTFAYLFDRQGTAVAAIFAADKENVTRRKTIQLALPAGQVKAYDMMGNQIALSGPQIEYGRQPVYLEGSPRLAVEALRAALASGVIREVEDRTAPSISICDGPRGTVPQRSVRLRWIAIDETAIPIAGLPANAIEYSYRLVGRDTDWSPWTANTRADYEGLSPGDYHFEVRARDLTGNVSPTIAREFEVERR